MKKAVAFLCLVIMCVSLCACDPASFVISPDFLKDVTYIELIEYKNPDQKQFSTWVPDQFNDLKPFDDSNATVIEILPEEKVSDFLDAFMQADILHTYYAYDSPSDICIKLNYASGNFLIIWANYNAGTYAGYIGEYLPDGTVTSFWGSFSSLKCYERLVNDFFDYKILSNDK